MKVKNVIIYFLFCIIILVLFKMPESLLKIVENNVENQLYEKNKISKTIDIQTEKIYLVKAIHEIENDDSKISITSSEKNWALSESSTLENESKTELIPDILKKQLKKFEEFNILKNLDIYENKQNVKLISTIYQGDENYIINKVFLNTTNELYNIEMEEKTEKILFINFSKENLVNEIDKKDLLLNYVKYLDLYIIDDWKYENNTLKSEKAGLIVSLLENKTRYILSIHGIEKGLYTSIYEYNETDTK